MIKMKSINPADSMEKEYESIATFYNGTLRDAALFVFLYNQVAANRDFDTIEEVEKGLLEKIQ